MIAKGSVILTGKVVGADSLALLVWQMKKALVPFVERVEKSKWDSFFTNLFSINNIQVNEV